MIFVFGKSNVTFHYTYFTIAANMLMIITGTLIHNVQHSTLWIPWLVGLMKTSKFKYLEIHKLLSSIHLYTKIPNVHSLYAYT